MSALRSMMTKTAGAVVAGAAIAVIAAPTASAATQISQEELSNILGQSNLSLKDDDGFDFNPGDEYVALGDSYTAMGSPLASMEMIQNASDINCVRSDDGLAERIAIELDADLVNASCSGAVPGHYWNSQSPIVGPQRDALSADTKLVTVTMGGNLLIPESLENPIQCGIAILDGNGACEAKLRSTGVEDELAAMWADIKEKAPNAKILAVGYVNHELDGGIFDGGGIVPLYNKVIKDAADAAGIEWADPGEGMDITGFLKGGWGMHPSTKGNENATLSVLDILGVG